MTADPHQPIRRRAFTLTRADALMWESLPAELSGWRKWLYFLWLALAGCWPTFLPADWQSNNWLLFFSLLIMLGLHWVVASTVMTLASHCRARRRVPQPVAGWVEDWGDHLLYGLAGHPAQPITPELTRQTVAAGACVFIDAPPVLVILPAMAFDDDADRDSFVRCWEERSKAAAL